MNIDFPLVSIVLPTYNGSKYISEAIESCLNQTYVNIELIIVNDASTDNVVDIIKKYKHDHRVKIINHTINKTLPGALNTGFQAAAGKYYTWTSDDNIYSKNAIEIMLNIISESNDFDIIYTDFTIIRENGTSYLCKTGPSDDLLIFNSIGACFLFKSAVYHSLNGYNNDLFLVEDYDFWIRAYYKYKFKKIDMDLYTYRLHNETLTSTKKDRINSMLIELMTLNIEYSKHNNYFSDDHRLRAYLKLIRLASSIDNHSLANSFYKKAASIDNEALNRCSDELRSYITSIISI